MSYPADYGFIEGTIGGDGDPLDALVLVGDPPSPAAASSARVIGVFHMTDEKGRTEGDLRVAEATRLRPMPTTYTTSPPEFRDEIEHFFQVYKQLEDKETETRGFGNRARRCGDRGSARAAIVAGLQAR